MKLPKNDSRYSWTLHAVEKMQFYGLSEGRIKRIIRFPKRVEEGIAPDTVAVMQPAGTKRYQELWVMYKIDKPETDKQVTGNEETTPFKKWETSNARLKIITAWRYPGESPARDPIPADVIREIQRLL